jgi:hypothetical protein
MTSNSTNPYQSPSSGDGLISGSTSSSLAPRAITLVTMIVAAAATRVVPHPWNFTAVGAMCLFGGAHFRRRWQAFLVPLAALVISDIVLAATRYDFSLFGYTSIWVGYGLFALTALIGMLLRGRVTVGRVAAAAVGASVMFFLVSNLVAWVEGHGGYPYTPAGLVACYVAAIPFAQNMFLANLFYSAVLFGGYELLSLQWPALRQPALAKVTAR